MKPTTLSSSERQLIALVRSSLRQKPAEEELFMSDCVDWQKIGELALQQTVGILAFEGALNLPENLLPPKEWVQKALAFIESNRRTHKLVDKCVGEAVASLRDKGIATILLKGQAYARVYPRPDMRQCGDIDLYVGEKNYYAAYRMAAGCGWESKEQFHQKAKHYGCELRGVRIELHREAAKMPFATVDRKFQKWSSWQMSHSERTIAIANQEIGVPTPLFDIVFVFLHLYHHFINGGIGLRHICDWTVLLHAHYEAININELEEKLKELRLMRAWRVLAPIPVHYLGLPEAECPFYSREYEKRSEKVISTIMKEGNFGRAKKKRSGRPEGYLAGKLFSFRQIFINHLNKIGIDPFGTGLSLCRSIIAGSANTLKDITRGGRR